MGGTVFGSWLAPLATFTALGVIAAAIALHVGAALGVAHSTDPFVDELAFAAFGLIFGLAPAAHAAAEAAAAHHRLDAINAPPANGSSST